MSFLPIPLCTTRWERLQRMCLCGNYTEYLLVLQNSSTVATEDKAERAYPISLKNTQ
jgi:hypothetical protein